MGNTSTSANMSCERWMDVTETVIRRTICTDFIYHCSTTNWMIQNGVNKNFSLRAALKRKRKRERRGEIVWLCFRPMTKCVPRVFVFGFSKIENVHMLCANDARMRKREKREKENHIENSKIWNWYWCMNKNMHFALGPWIECKTDIQPSTRRRHIRHQIVWFDARRRLLENVVEVEWIGLLNVAQQRVCVCAWNEIIDHSADSKHLWTSLVQCNYDVSGWLIWAHWRTRRRLIESHKQPAPFIRIDNGPPINSPFDGNWIYEMVYHSE